MTFVNATPHEIKIFKEDKKTLLKTIPVGEFVIRLDTEPQKYIKHVEDIPIYTNQKFTGLNLGHKEKDIKQIGLDNKKVYIVSYMVKDYIKEHHPKMSDIFYIPDGNEGAVRENGMIIGTTRLLN